MKYVIDIEEKPLCEFDKETQTYFPRLFKVKGFNTLVFDQEGLKRLELLDSSEEIERAFEQGKVAGVAQQYDVKEFRSGYECGMKDCWELAREIADMSGDVLDEIFGGSYWPFAGGCEMTPFEAKEKVDSYKKKIKIGDLIEDKSGTVYLVIDITDGAYQCLSGESFEPVSIGKDYIKEYKNLHDCKDIFAVARGITKGLGSRRKSNGEE